MSATTEVVKAPKIGLIATLLSTVQGYRGAGIHTYSHQLLRHLPQRTHLFQFLVYVGDHGYRPDPGLTLRRTRISTQRPYGRILWEQALLPLLARREQLDLIHGLAYATPLFSGIPNVVTVHDLSFLLYPKIFHSTNRHYLSRITLSSCKRARRVIAVSQATKADLHQILGIPLAKIDVVYNGVDNVFRPLPESEVNAFRIRAQWPERFILTVGTLEPRKNHVGLLEGYARYRRMSRQPLPLLIGGGQGWDYEVIFERVEQLQLESHVRFLGFVPVNTLPWLYNAASLFVYPSLYEGFGLPVAEAMACGVPSITSTASSLPEVAGDAALVIDPDDPDKLALAMMSVLENDDQWQVLRDAGLAQSKRFSWEITASDTASVYASALEGQNG